MSDEEDYSSADDEDYVPSDKEGLSEEDESGEEEDLAVLNEGGASENGKATGKGKRKRKTQGELVARKRKGGIKLEGEEEAESAEKTPEEDLENQQLKEEIVKEKENQKQEKEKKKADDLWASFMSDVGQKPKPKPSITKAPSGAGLGSLTTLHTKPAPKPLESLPDTASSSSTNTPAAQKITVTKVFDFAGEEVKIQEQVDVKSKEGQKELKRLESENGNGDTKESSEKGEKSSDSESSSSGLAIPSKSSPKPAGGLGSVLGKIGKKNKLSTLTKSKLDWDSYKKDEGIDDDLKIYNRGKGGYIERMQFLQRADVRQFEIEKSLRQTSSKR